MLGNIANVFSYTSQNLIVNIILLVSAGLILVGSSGLLVRTLTKLSSYLGLSQFIISFILMAFATSLPELFVGISSGLRGVPTLSLGDVIGANIVNLTLVMGIAIFLARKIKTESITKGGSLYMFIISILPLILLIDGVLSRAEGAVLIGVFLIYAIRLVSKKKKIREELGKEKKNFLLNAVLFVLGVFLLLVSANFVVNFASDIAIQLEIPIFLIGLVGVALGTSLPELVFGARAVISKLPELSLGDSMGSVVINSALILGVVALIEPIRITSFNAILGGVIFLLISLIAFTVMIRTSKRLSWKEGTLLLFIYILFIVTQIYIKR